MIAHNPHMQCRLEVFHYPGISISHTHIDNLFGPWLIQNIIIDFCIFKLRFIIIENINGWKF